VQAIRPAASPRDAASALLERLGAFSPEGAEAELPVALEALAWSGKKEDRLWVALLTLRARADAGRDARALALLERGTEELSQEGADLASAESLVRSLLESRIEAGRTIQRSDERLASALGEVQHLEARLRETRKNAEVLGARLQGEEKKTAALETSLAQQQKKTTALQDQIDQLKSIERIIDRRAEPKEAEAEK
jgi:chromosome segregation ATPase